MRILILTFALISLFPVGLNSQTPTDNWPQFRGNLQLTGLSNSNLPDKLRLLWTYEAGESIESSAAIVDGTVYVGSRSGDLIAIDLNNGKLKWKYHTQGAIGESSPAVSNGIVYIGDYSGMVYALNASDGRKIWTHKTGAEVKSSPVVTGNQLLIGSYDNYLYCLNSRTGTLIWKFKTDNYVHATASAARGIAYIAGCDETFRGIRIATGREIFRTSAGGYTGSSPALSSQSAQSAYFGNFNNELLSIDLNTHQTAWRYQHPDRQFPYYSSPAIADNKVVVGSRDKMVHCNDAATGKSLWTFQTQARVESSPAIANGRVYIGSSDGRLYVIDLNTGSKLWEFNAGAAITASPAIAGGRLIIGSQDGRLYCFG